MRKPSIARHVRRTRAIGPIRPAVLSAALSAVAGVFAYCPNALGTDYSWTAAGGGDFNTPANWSPAGPPIAGDTAIFANNITGTVSFSANAASALLALRNTSGAITLDLDNSTFALGSITLANAAGDVNDLTITDGTISHSSTGTLFSVGAFAGSDGNKLTITGANTYVISTSTSTSLLGVAGSNNNVLTVSNAASYNVRNNITVGAVGATPSSGNIINITDASFAITNGNRGIRLYQGTLNITNSYADIGGFIQANDPGNTGVVNFNSGTMYARWTRIDNGLQFKIGDGGAIPAVYGMSYSAPTASFANGLLINSNGKLIGSGTITGNITAAAGAKVAPSIIGQPPLLTDDRSYGTFGVTGTWDNTNIEMTLDIASFANQPVNPPIDAVLVNGNFTQGGTVKIDLSGYIPPQDNPQDLRLVGWSTYSGNFTDTTVQFVNGSPLTYDFRSDGLYVQIPVVAANSAWNVDADGSWTTATNWSPANPPNGIGGVANFGAIITAPRTVTVTTARTVGAMNFDNANAYTIAGAGPLTMDVTSGAASINVISGSHTISAPITLNDDLTVTVTPAASTLSLTGDLNASGKSITKEGAGTAQVERLIASALAVNAGTARVSSKALSNDPAGTSVLSALSIAGGAALDLSNNSAVLDYTGTSVQNDVLAHLAAGRLISSSQDATRRLGYGEASATGFANGTFAGQPVDADAVLVKFTYAGDTNLDGQVDITDLGNLATNWQTAGVWTTGDLDYSGFIDITDLGLLATNWQAGVGSPMGQITLAAALNSLGLGGMTVPEPCGAGVVALFGLLGSVRRRR